MVKNINPVSSNVCLSKVVHTGNGGLVVSCENSEDSNKFKNNNYTIKEVLVLNPRFKIVGMSEQLSDEELINCLKIQNINEIVGDLTVISHFPLKKNNKLHQAVIQCDISTYKNDYCSIYDAIDLRRCFKCCGYHNSSRVCK
ncbi:unnamed protein product [Psylliodes chrysocephalus]|uniref:Uncharacterized protein n=1 Tax=Psylliodes chrysocephalus TaxID=3402493 RepID=A0A9P0G8E3_9CUCU|nr:unnamed protein product [Psylliodes chrysocephala]